MTPSNAKLKTGLIPKTICETKSAVIAEAMVDNNMMGEKYLKISSTANIAPAKGALKAAARPALAPLAIKILFSVLQQNPSFSLNLIFQLDFVVYYQL